MSTPLQHHQAPVEKSCATCCYWVYQGLDLRTWCPKAQADLPKHELARTSCAHWEGDALCTCVMELHTRLTSRSAQ